MKRCRLAVAHSMSQSKKGVTMAQVMNPNPTAVKIHKGEKVGEFQVVDEHQCVCVVNAPVTNAGVRSQENLGNVINSLVCDAEDTRKDAHPIPRIEESLDALHGECWFSTLDLASGYWQVGVAAKDRKKTAFSIPFGLYQFCVMLFGLCNAPSTFQRLMEFVLTGLHWSS